MSQHSNYDALVAQDRDHLIHPYLPLSVDQRIVIERGLGAKLWDSHGREYIDATGGGLCVSQIGHGRAELAEAAMQQMQRLEYHTVFNQYTHEPAIRLASRVAELAPAGLDHVFFTNSGSEANDSAYLIARFFHHQNGSEDRTWILSRRNAYHGKTFGSGTTTGFPKAKVGLGPEMPFVAHLTPPHPYLQRLRGEDPTEFCARELEDTIERIGPEKIAAFVGEPIMGVAGMVLPPDDYWQRIKAVLDRHGILLIFDEVVTAFGRVGEWFAAEKYSATPDMIVTAKGITSGYLPLGAVVMSGAIADTIRAQRGFPFGFTYSGHPVAAAVALKNLEIIEREGLLQRAETMGAYFMRGLRPLEQLPAVGEVRGAGLGFGIELVRDKSTGEALQQGPVSVVDAIREDHGVFVRISGDSSLTMYPPLVITEGEADQVIAAVTDVLGRLRPDGSIR